MQELFTTMKTEFQQICQEKKTDRIQSLEDEVRTLNKKIKKLEENSDESEAYSRRDTIILPDSDLARWKFHWKLHSSGFGYSEKQTKSDNQSKWYIDRPSCWKKSCQQHRQA